MTRMKAKAKEFTWGTRDGRRLKPSEITDDHLKNIIKDGYRHPALVAEAKRRKFAVPVRPVDNLTFSQLMIYIESFASCAIEGNQLGAKMLKLYESKEPRDKDLFYLNLNQFMEKEQAEAAKRN